MFSRSQTGIDAYIPRRSFYNILDPDANSSKQ